MSEKWHFFDKITFTILILIIIIGMILVFSATYKSEGNLFTKHIIKTLFSLTLFFVIFFIKTQTILRWSTPLFIFFLGVLLIQLLAGKIMAGTKSWIKMGFLTVQVSEFVKISISLVLAKYFVKFSIIDWKNFFKISGILLLPFILIALQPDLGTAFILLSIFFFTIIIKKIKLSIVFFLIISVFAGSFLLWNYSLKGYQKKRVVSFLNPEKYSKTSGYQVIQSKIAFGSGGINGKGFLKGSQSHLKFLPTRHTDFISSVLGEEFGFMGITMLLILFFLFFYRQFNFKVRNDEEFYFITLFNGMLFFQFLINVLMVTGFFPVMGIPLPFVSYGGSSMLAFLIGEGIIFKMKLNYFISKE